MSQEQEIKKLKEGIDESNNTRQERIEESRKNIDSKKIELAYNNSLKFTSNQFYKSLKKLIGDNI